MSAKAAQKERTHESILDSACRLMRERGIGGARVADVMKGAGLTVGGFYAHFASKEDLVDHVFRRTAAAARDRFLHGIDDKPAEARVEVLMKRYLSTAHRDASSDGCPMPAVVGEVATTAPEHGEVLAEGVDLLATAIQARLPTSGSASTRRTIALGVVALMFGGLTLARATRGTPLSDEMLKACRAFGKLAVG
jgi:TetR/AcrR family transcriptional regulator, transcriptional repressor for nem operon